MSTVRDLAKSMAEIALDEGQRIAFNISIKLCEKLSAAYATRGDQAGVCASQECANLIKGLRDKLERDGMNKEGIK